MPGRHNPPDPVQVDGETEWEVDNILAVRKHHGKLQYRIKWLGYDDDPDSRQSILHGDMIQR